MSVSVSTLMRRVKFVPMDAGDVGAGTEYPMLVTLDQIAEIYHRAKTVSFDSAGSITVTNDGFAFPITINAPGATTPPLVKLRHQLRRGYSMDDDLITARGYEDYFGAAYAVSGDSWADVADNERAILLPGVYDTAFSFYSYLDYPDYTDPDAGECFTVDPAIDCEAKILFSGLIGVVRSNPGDSMWCAGNLYYLGLNVWIFSSVVAAGTIREDNPTVACNFTFRLAGAIDVSCPLYIKESYADVASSYTVTSSNDFVLTITEWWPYAKGSPATPVWDEDDGSKL